VPYYETVTVEHWTSVLRLASKWEFTSLRELAIKRLFDITSPLEKITLAHSFDLAHWLPSAYTDLCERVAPLSIEEGRKLGKLGQLGGDIVILLYLARHEIAGLNIQNDRANAMEVVKNVFGLGCPPPPEDPSIDEMRLDYSPALEASSIVPLTVESGDVSLAHIKEFDLVRPFGDTVEDYPTRVVSVEAKPKKGFKKGKKGGKALDLGLGF